VTSRNDNSELSTKSLTELLGCSDSVGALLDSMPGGLFIVDPDSRIIYWNKAVERMTGYPADEIIGQHCSILKGSTCTGEPLATGERCNILESDCINNRLCRIRRKDGSQVEILKNVSLLYDSTGELVGAIESVTDIGVLRPEHRDTGVLTSPVPGPKQFGGIVGKSHQMQEVYNLIKLVADSDASVLLLGESGTGKELIARAIHNNSHRSKCPLVKVNCSALAETLLESELFGHIRGAFTGATYDKVGRFEAADGGTIFLDEIGDISPVVQIKLLRVVQEKQFERVGESSPLTSDVRIITATNKDLTGLVGNGSFREDLYYRLKVVEIQVPPLRQRKEDIPLLVEHFVDRFRHMTGKEIEGCAGDALTGMLDYDWPGNVRELENAIEHAFVTCQTSLITIFDLPREIRQTSLGHRPFKKHREIDLNSRETILAALTAASWNRSEAARRLGVSRTTLWKKIRLFDLHPE